MDSNLIIKRVPAHKIGDVPSGTVRKGVKAIYDPTRLEYILVTTKENMDKYAKELKDALKEFDDD